MGRFTTEDPARDGLNWYAYYSNNPINYVDRNGLWKSNIHYNKTIEFAISAGFQTDAYIEFLARADEGTDNGGLNPMPWGNQSYHFDRDSYSGDTRIDHAEECLSYAINRWNESETMYANDLKDAESISDPKRKAFAIESANSALENRRYDALESLGQGLHALQDVDAHGQIGALDLIASHVGMEGIDDVNYDWSNSYQNKVVNSTEQKRYNNTKDASIEYLKKFKECIAK